MAKVIVSFITLGNGDVDGSAVNVVKAQVGASFVETVGAVATTAASRITVPAKGKEAGANLYARIASQTGNVMCSIGVSPTASQTAGMPIFEKMVEVFKVNPGEKLSFIELTT